MKSQTKANLLYTTTQTREEARRISSAVVSEGLAACANIIGGIESIYFWDGCVREEAEIGFFLKTSAVTVKPLIDRIKELHSYECPCIIVQNISEGNPDFINWVCEQTKMSR